MKKHETGSDILIPSYALNYLINGDETGIEEHQKGIIERWLTNYLLAYRNISHHVISIINNYAEYCHAPEFGLGATCQICRITVFFKRGNIGHTAGTWMLDDNNGIIYGSMRYEICKMPSDKDEDIANAQLIATAPELLEALQLAVDRLAPHFFKIGIKKAYSELLVIEEMKKVIKRAIKSAETN